MKSSHLQKRVLVMGALGDEKFASKVAPLFQNRNVARVYLFRYRGNPVSVAREKVVVPFVKYRLPRRFYDALRAVFAFSLCLFGKVDLIVGIYFYPHGVLSGLLGRLFNIPVIQILPGTDLDVYLKKHYFSRVMASAHAIGLRGEISKQQLLDAGRPPEQLFILNNVFEPEAPEETDFQSIPTFDLITIGYLIERKRFDVFLKLVARLKARFPDIRCLVVGDGPLRNRLERMATDLGVAENVTFHGVASSVSELLRRARVFVMTSRLEGLPMAIVEAMSCGLPVVAPGINDIPTLVAHGRNGFLVDDSDISSYVDFCERLLANEEMRVRMGADAGRTVAKLCSGEYSFAAVSRVWSHLLSGIETNSSEQQARQAHQFNLSDRIYENFRNI